MDPHDKLVAGGILALQDLERPVEGVIVLDIKELGRVVILEQFDPHDRELAVEAGAGNGALVEAVDREVEVAVIGWDCHFESRFLAVVDVLIVPVVAVSLVVSIMSNLEVIKAGQKVGVTDEIDTVVLRCLRVDSVRNLRNVVLSPRAIG